MLLSKFFQISLFELLFFNYYQLQNFFFFSECIEYSDWLDGLVASMEPVSIAKEEAHNFSLKLKDVMKNLETTMEIMFTYDTMYNEVNETYEELSFHQNGISEKNSVIEESLNQGKSLIDEAKTCISDGENHLQVTFLFTLNISHKESFKFIQSLH